MKIINRFFAALLFVISSPVLWATNAKYESELYTLNVTYNEKIIPGDAVFARMKITTPKKKGKLGISNRECMKGKRRKKWNFIWENVLWFTAWWQFLQPARF